MLFYIKTILVEQITGNGEFGEVGILVMIC
jgi:hypothetical protein